MGYNWLISHNYYKVEIGNDVITSCLNKHADDNNYCSVN